VCDGRELYGLFHVAEIAMPRDAEGRLVSPWNLVQAVLGDEIKQQRHCVADLSLYEFLRQRLTERNLPARVYILVQKPLPALGVLPK
jgi:hypothetical protein